VQLEEQLDSGTPERVERQVDLLLRIYEAELAKNPTSRAAESSRSNMIALRHIIEQIYGKGRCVAVPLKCRPRGAYCRRTGGDENASVTASPL
jgi:hypothetical protein